LSPVISKKRQTRRIPLAPISTNTTCSTMTRRRRKVSLGPLSKNVTT
jgi:hypothetical protein